MAKTKILIQAGHIAPREPGFEGGTGTTHEQEYVTRMRALLNTRFKADGRFDITLSPGDIPDGWGGKVALYLHLDGSGSRESSGFSFGYQTMKSEQLAKRIRQNFRNAGHPGRERQDNYTADLHGYYGFRRTNADYEVLIEHGFGTNPSEYAWLEANADRLADATYKSVIDELGLGRPGVIRRQVLKAKLTKEQIEFRNRLTVKRITPEGQVTTWQGWRSDGTGANSVLRVLAMSPEALDFRSSFNIAWQGHWFLQSELGTHDIINVAKSIWARYAN